MSQTTNTSPTADREITGTRLFDASPETVFATWTDPAHISNWWGPRGFTTTTKSIDVRVGGSWKFVMHGPDGVDYNDEIHYIEVESPARLVYDHIDADTGDGFRTTVTFTNEDGKTRLTMTALFPSAEIRDMVAEKHAAHEGMNQTLDRFQEELSSSSDITFTVTRTVNAPRDLVFTLWTDPNHLAKWWGPKGFECITKKLELRPGGVYHYHMKTDSNEMWGKFVYREVTPPSRLVFLSSFSDADGNTARAPFSNDWPLEVLNVLTFTETDGKTTMTLRGAPINTTAAERELFASMHSSMQQGFGGTFDNLDAYIAEL
ncbi:MAG TPA: SRPBCC family protein [Capsulimonadaceae bacterium]|jgi:uncharacterized protein YndB with AHSA1/START domain